MDGVDWLRVFLQPRGVASRMSTGNLLKCLCVAGVDAVTTLGGLDAWMLPVCTVDAFACRLLLVGPISLVPLIPQVRDVVACPPVGCKLPELAQSWTGAQEVSKHPDLLLY